MRKELEIGQIVESTAGRDAGRYFLVSQIDGKDFCFVVDGRLHKQSKPKRKRFKHLRVTDITAESVRMKWLARDKVFDSEVASVLKQYNFKSKGVDNGKE